MMEAKQRNDKLRLMRPAMNNLQYRNLKPTPGIKQLPLLAAERARPTYPVSIAITCQLSNCHSLEASSSTQNGLYI